MSVREMTLGKLIMGTSGLVEGLPSREAVIELDRRERELLDRVAKLEARFPVPVEREAWCEKCREAKPCSGCTYRAESTGKQCVECGVYVEKARECYAQPTCYECLPPPEPLLIAPAPAAPTDEWTTILELGPGDIFETPSGNRGAKNENGSVLWFWKVGSYEGPYQPVRKLHVLNPGEIAVRVDEATVDRVAKQVFAHGIPFERSGIIAREILELLRAESKGGGWK